MTLSPAEPHIRGRWGVLHVFQGLPEGKKKFFFKFENRVFQSFSFQFTYGMVCIKYHC